MKSLKQKVIKDAERRLQQRIGSPAWLQEALTFDHSLQLKNVDTKPIQKIFHQCGKADRIENRTNFEVLIANLINAKTRKPVRVSLSPNRWKKTRYTTAGASTIDFINLMNNLGYLEKKKGYYNEEGESREARIWPTEKLLTYFPKVSKAVKKEPVELVELRNDEGNLIDYIDTKQTKRIRSILENVNKVNKQADIGYYKDKLNASLIAVFKRSFSLYGRLHTRGYRHYQGQSEDERAEITINGDPVIELDYSGLHPYLIYAKEGIQFFGDPYTIVDDRAEARPFLKQILLCMLNATDELKAERAANYWLYKNHSERKALNEIGITRARPLMETFREEHSSINHYFCNGKDTGLRIMNLDAQIALDIVNHFTNAGIPILAVHDSFIVQLKHRKKLKQIMQKQYQNHANGFRIKIK